VGTKAGVSRREGVVLLRAQVVRVQVEHADHERQKDQEEDDHELEDVLDGPPERDLQRPEALVGREDVSDPGEAQHHGHRVQTLRHQLGVRGQPVEPRCRHTTWESPDGLLHTTSQKAS